MTDPATRHAVCPECHTHQLTLPDGRIGEHAANGNRCPGSEDWPNRSAGNGTAYDVTSQFASCPAATGEPYDREGGCEQFPDGAHRCGSQRGHIRTDSEPVTRRVHRCTCGYTWTCLTGTFDDLYQMIARPA